MTDHSGRIASLEAERDAWIAEHNETIRINLLLRAENAALRQAFEDAPHDPGCSAVVYRMGDEEAGEDDFVPVNGPCDCWKTRISVAGDERIEA